MAKQVVNNGESGLVVRGKINDNFTELYDIEADDIDVIDANDYFNGTNVEEVYRTVDLLKIVH